MTKRIVITGGNAGIGYETALALAKLGHFVSIIGRTKHKCEQAVYSINQATQNDHCNYFLCDLSDQNEIKKTALLIRAKYDIIDVLINNAGQVFTSFQTNEAGIEMQFATNHLAYFVLSFELLPLLQKSSDARIINVSSNSHYRGKIDFSNLYFKEKYKFAQVYAQSKLCNVLFTYKLADLLASQHITVNALHPGLVRTKIGTKNTKWWESLAWKLWSLRGISVEEGAKTSIYLASDIAGQKNSGKYWNKCKMQESSPISYDRDLQDKLWEISEGLTAVNYNLDV